MVSGEAALSAEKLPWKMLKGLVLTLDDEQFDEVQSLGRV